MWVGVCVLLNALLVNHFHGDSKCKLALGNITESSVVAKTKNNNTKNTAKERATILLLCK